MVFRSFGFICVLAFSSTLFADTLVWEATQQNLGNFGQLSLTTGAFTQVGAGFGFTPAGLGEIGTTLYTANAGGLNLYKVDTVTGAVSTVGTSSISYFTFGSTNTGLYMVDTVGGLWNINPTTGASTLIGSTHLDLTTSPYVGLSTGSNTLYMSLGSNVYSINTSTGSATFVGTSGSTDFGAMVDVSGAIYGTSVVSPNAIYSFNPTTGTANLKALSLAPAYGFGLAPIMPEPGSLGLVGLAALALAGYGLKKKGAFARS